MAELRKSEGFWGPSQVKGQKTRREEQDAYRKALDSQIQQRKLMDQKRLDQHKAEYASQKAVSDPIQHLMPWRNDSVNSQSKKPQTPSSNSGPIVHHSIGSSSMPMQINPHPYGPNVSFYGQPGGVVPPPPPHPHAQQISYPQSSYASHEQNVHANNSNIAQFHPHQNVAYGYYGTPPTIPPPPAYIPYAQLPPAGYIPYHQANPMVPCGVHQALQHINPNAPEQRSEAKDPSNREYKPDVMVKKHISQMSEDAPDQSIVKDHYRNDLQRQMEERRKIEEERKNKEKNEEEQLQRRVQEDQERMTKEFDAEEKRRREKEEEKRLKDIEIQRKTREVQEHERLRREQEKEIKRKEKLEMKKQEMIEEELLNTSISSCVDNPFDSTPLPSLAHHQEAAGKQVKPDFGGGGDNNMANLLSMTSINNNNNNNNDINNSKQKSSNFQNEESRNEVKVKSSRVEHSKNETYRKRNAHTSIGESPRKNEVIYVPGDIITGPTNRRKNPEEDSNNSTHKKCSTKHEESMQFFARLKQVLEIEGKEIDRQLKQNEEDSQKSLSKIKINGRNITIS